MQKQSPVSMKPTEFRKNNTYDLGKTVITVDNVFRKSGLNINHILSRLIKSEVEEKIDENQKNVWQTASIYDIMEVS